MKITYTNTFRDSLAFQLYHQSHSPVMLLIGASALCFIAYNVFGMTADPAKGIGLAPRIVGTLIFTAIVMLILIGLQFVITVLNMVSRKNKTFLTGHTIVLGEDGFVSESDFARTDFKWSVVQKLRRTRRHLFIYASQHSAVVVPRRAFHDEAEWEAFHEICLRKTGSKPVPADSATD